MSSPSHWKTFRLSLSLIYKAHVSFLFEVPASLNASHVDVPAYSRAPLLLPLNQPWKSPLAPSLLRNSCRSTNMEFRGRWPPNVTSSFITCGSVKGDSMTGKASPAAAALPLSALASPGFVSPAATPRRRRIAATWPGSLRNWASTKRHCVSATRSLRFVSVDFEKES